VGLIKTVCAKTLGAKNAKKMLNAKINLAHSNLPIVCRCFAITFKIKIVKKENLAEIKHDLVVPHSGVPRHLTKFYVCFK
jgi:hypothetical protein